MKSMKRDDQNPPAVTDNTSVSLIAELAGIKEYVDNEAELFMVHKGHEFATEKHKDQKRESGEPYITHLVAVAQILIDFRLDPLSICAALLHDVIEDTATAASEIEQEFGQEVLDLVQGMTKLPKQEFVSGDEHQAENYRKMLFASARDLRIIFIKLADRLHNMRTLKYLPLQKQTRIAKETMEIYAPLANRLGIARMKWELEDLAFRYLDPEIYQNIRKQMTRKRREREKHIEQYRKIIHQKLTEAGIDSEILGRPKHFYSIFQKMKRQNISFDSIYDLAGVRIICNENEDKHCYHALGIIHTMWPPIEGRFKDHIALPKSNMYQSIHTTVIGPKGVPLEIQIRTREMDKIAEVGIAAHWKYKEVGRFVKKYQERFDWLQQLIEWMKELQDPKDFLENFKIDLFPNEIYIFTPKGEVKFLPRGATPIDFAFLIHSDIGVHCVGANVNGKIVPLNYQLQSGDLVSIQTSKKQNPSADWLKFVKTSKARSKIKRTIHDQHRRESIDLGKNILNQEFRKLKRNLNRYLKLHEKDFMDIAKRMGLQDLEDLFAHIGVGKVNAYQITQKLVMPEPKSNETQLKQDESRLEKIVKKAFGLDGALKIDGLDNMLISYAKCCHPVPGDEIIGFITRGRGVSIHTQDCPNIEALKKGGTRLIDVSWHITKKTSFTVHVQVTAQDRKGLFADTTSTITKMNSNILSGQMEVHDYDEEASGIFLLEVKDIQHLNKIIAALHKVKGIIKVTRLRT
ncbi:RelA/SpoT family protein [candidate division CSSED10-310 bacterium]|uniref:RelA/SpoT family protein n=1 Tax=candidate division CSSED10-310 bacterium TaxID=2855610 RepID=A0ABV6Z3U0_UNCC1